ncbi:hypothetical protein D5270_14325 [Acutalibacter sp. 1XD8-36]|nr:hypothetical protein [Acutalibacter sp. 1XD8-36]
MRRLIGGGRLCSILLSGSLHVLWILLCGLDRRLLSMLPSSRLLSSILLCSTLLPITLLGGGRLGLGLLLTVPGRGGLLCLLRCWSMFHVLIIHMQRRSFMPDSRNTFLSIIHHPGPYINRFCPSYFNLFLINC